MVAAPAPWGQATTSRAPGFDDENVVGAVPPDTEPYDVFISYAANVITNAWLHEFVPLFSAWLEERLARRARVFSQDTALLNADWQAALDRHLDAARTLVVILTPTYFNSQFNRREWDAFAHSRPDRLFPVMLTRSDSYPEDVNTRQWADFTPFAFVGEGFSKTEVYVEFQRAVHALASAVGAKINAQSDTVLAQTNERVVEVRQV
jgi:hypothetical protein